ncbi:MFS transporter [Microbacterium sediminicola]|uniref:MFS transporter n=1 Tax=Microbacterium sediminicola TaxID=415210 RepID=UPI0031D027EB
MSHQDPAESVHPRTATILLSQAAKWRAFAVAVSVAALTILDLSKVNVSLPSIEASLGADSTQLQLIVSGYVLAFGLFLVPMGRLGDQRSRRALFIVGLATFTLASLACALAPTAELLMAARFIQGIGAGIQMPQVLGIIQQIFVGKERGRAFGLFGAVISISTAIGPTLGGLLIALGGDGDGWRWIFWINLPLGLAAIAAAIWVLPTTKGRSPRPVTLDPVGVILFGLAIFALMWPFLFTTGSPDDDPMRWWLLVVFVVVAALFVAWERRYAASGKVPLIPFSLFQISSYRNATLLVTFYFAGLPALFLLTTLYLQTGLGLAPVFAGMVGIGFAVASAVGSWIGGNLVSTHGRGVVVWGLIIVLAAIAGLVATAVLVPAEWAPYAMAGVMVFAGAGGGLVVSPNQTLALADIPVREGGLAGSLGQLGQRIGTAVGTAVGLALFYATIFRESDSKASLEVYHDAYMIGSISVAVFISLALVIGVVDMTRRRRGAASDEFQI